jgi:hypothetical protein
MVHALGTPKRHPESGIYLFRKRVPERLKASVGKSEIKFSLQTRDPAIARIRNLEETVRLERAWSGIDVTLVDSLRGPVAHFECKSTVGTPVVAARDAATERADANPAAPAAEAAPKTPVPLRSIFASYAKEAALAPSTVKRWSPVLERLIGHLGHDDAGAITRGEIIAWKDALLVGGMSNVTVRDVYLAATKATLQCAVDQEHLAENPAAGVKVRAGDNKSSEESPAVFRRAALALGVSSYITDPNTTVPMRRVAWFWTSACLD